MNLGDEHCGRAFLHVDDHNKNNNRKITKNLLAMRVVRAKDLEARLSSRFGFSSLLADGLLRTSAVTVLLSLC